MNKELSHAHCLMLVLGLFAGVGVLTSFSALAATRTDAQALIDALEDQGVDAVSDLVHGGADINAQKSGDGTVLMEAAKRGDLIAVERLLALGADVNQWSAGDGTALITAASQGHLPVVKRLIGAGARVDMIVDYDETALIAASRNGRLDVVQYLVEQKADINLGVTTPTGQWRTPLNQARTSDIKTYLVKHGARVSRR